jgi:hypothetical protein
MGTLKSTLKLESTDLFPTPVSFTKINNNTVEGSFSGFISIVAGTVQKKLNVSPIDTGVAYVYLESPAANSVPVLVQAGTTGSVFAVLNPGEIAFLPYGQDTLGGDDLYAVTLTGNATLQYFIGEKE